MKVYIGTTGWGYSFWKGSFYPKKIPSMLAYYASKSHIVEINSTYYSLPSSETIEKWDKETPLGFAFFAKMHQEITHTTNGLTHRIENLISFKLRFSNLSKLKGILLQFPYSFVCSESNELVLTGLVENLDGFQNLVIEIRNKSWFESRTLKELVEKGKVILATTSKLYETLDATKNQSMLYVRILGSRKEFPDHSLGKKRKNKSSELARWADFISEFQGDIAFVFVNNRFSGNAVEDAQKLNKILNERGIAVHGFKPTPSLEDFW